MRSPRVPPFVPFSSRTSARWRSAIVSRGSLSARSQSAKSRARKTTGMVLSGRWPWSCRPTSSRAPRVLSVEPTGLCDFLGPVFLCGLLLSQQLFSRIVCTTCIPSAASLKWTAGTKTRTGWRAIPACSGNGSARGLPRAIRPPSPRCTASPGRAMGAEVPTMMRMPPPLRASKSTSWPTAASQGTVLLTSFGCGRCCGVAQCASSCRSPYDLQRGPWGFV